jgi:hypothetical protein
MTRQPSLPRQQYVIFNHCASRQSGLRHDDTALPDSHIMSDLNEIVDFGAGPYDRITDTATIDRSVGAYFNVILDNATAHVFHWHVTIA